MKVKELLKILTGCDQDATVEVIHGLYRWDAGHPEECFYDRADNKYVTLRVGDS